ncbi:MAG TPA: hypothetical protein VLE43_03025 [Candidatus Saccharimonadia bacterium]|nr:hypothetical protein [Candidatus Saccharimonadia bacterium]
MGAPGAPGFDAGLGAPADVGTLGLPGMPGLGTPAAGETVVPPCLDMGTAEPPGAGATGLAATAGAGAAGLEGVPALGGDVTPAGREISPAGRGGVAGRPGVEAAGTLVGAIASGGGVTPAVGGFGDCVADSDAGGLPAANAFWPGLGSAPPWEGCGPWGGSGLGGGEIPVGGGTLNEIGCGTTGSEITLEGGGINCANDWEGAGAGAGAGLRASGLTAGAPSISLTEAIVILSVSGLTAAEPE